MNFRERFKPTAISTLQEQKQKADEISSSGTGAYHGKIEHGTTVKFRLYPAQNQGESFIYQRVLFYLPAYKDSDKQDAQGNTIKKLGKRTVFNSRAHSEFGRDICEEYVRFVADHYRATVQDAQILNTKLQNLSHFQKGINPSMAWIAYADKFDMQGNKTFAKLTLTSSAKNKMDDLMISTDPSRPEPFTHPDEGRAIYVSYDKNLEPKDKYKVALDYEAPSPLSDEELENLLSYPSLATEFENCYSRKDLEIALQGLKLWDEINSVYVWENPAWKLIVEEFRAAFPESASEETQTTSIENPPTKTTKPFTVTKTVEQLKKESQTASNQVELEEEGDDISISQMSRLELKLYIKNQQLPVRVMKSMKDDDIRFLIEEAQKEKGNNPLPWDKEEEDQGHVEDQKNLNPNSAKALDAIRANMSNKK